MSNHPSLIDSSLENTLRSIAPDFFKQADTLLDLHDYVTTRQHPGKCVDCYFQLYANTVPEKLPNLTPLRLWLERNIEIVAADQKQNLLEKIPLRLDGQNLEMFCRKIIDLLRTDRAFETPTVLLDFAFKA